MSLVDVYMIMREVLVILIFLYKLSFSSLAILLLLFFGRFYCNSMFFCIVKMRFIVLYNGKNVSLSRNLKVLRIIFVIFVSSFTAWLVWSSKESFVSIITPKSFCFSIVSSGYMELLSVLEYLISPMLLFPTVMCLHLLGRNFSNHLLLH